MKKKLQFKYAVTGRADVAAEIMERHQLKPEDINIILAAFGAGFTLGSVYLKWAQQP